MPKGYKHLTFKQRCHIFELKATGLFQKDIAKKIGVCATTISRELKRNSGAQGYEVWQSNYRAQSRRKKASQTPKKMTPEIIKRIQKHLREDWSPEQISGRLVRENILISHETIYKHVWQNRRSGGTLYIHLRHGGKKYKRRNTHKSGRGCIPDRVDIKERPMVVNSKSRIGDWEGDTIIGKNHKGAILSYVDRKSKMTMLEKLFSKQAEPVKIKTIKRFKSIKNKCLTITYDNGKEFSKHIEISKKIGANCYFATPYRSWERGLNEHTNGLVRQYFPKGTDFTKITNQQIKRVENLLNNRPRKVLGYRTPKEVFLEAG